MFHFRMTIFGIFSLTNKKKKVCQMAYPMLFKESSCVCMPSFGPVAPQFFLAKVTFLATFFFIQKGVWPHTHTKDIPLVKLILNINGLVGLTFKPFNL